MAQPSDHPREADTFRIAAIDLDEAALARHSADVEHERRVAMFDLLEDNHFHPVGSDGGPYHVLLSVEENRLTFDIKHEDGSQQRKVALSLTPFRRIVKDYFTVCESYYNAIRSATPEQIEAIDMGRRSLHNEGSELLKQRLESKIEVDFSTARRLFTLICVLHIKG